VRDGRLACRGGVCYSHTISIHYVSKIDVRAGQRQTEYPTDGCRDESTIRLQKIRGVPARLGRPESRPFLGFSVGQATVAYPQPLWHLSIVRWVVRDSFTVDSFVESFLNARCRVLPASRPQAPAHRLRERGEAPRVSTQARRTYLQTQSPLVATSPCS